VPKRADGASLERELDRLYGLPPGDFTPARNDLARELKRSGDAAGAGRVQGLKKPSRAAGAINRAARGNRREVKRLLDAAAKLGEAQEQLLQGGDRKGIQRAVERQRTAVEKLMEAVEAELERERGASEAMLGRARGTLHAVATDPDLRAELEAGRVSEDRTAVGLGPLTAGGAGGGGDRRPAGARGSAKKKEEARRRLKQAERELEDAERALRRAENERAEVAERLEAAGAAASSAERELAAAKSARDKARAALERT
jgi:chromosome segregation ATPase